MRNMRKKNAFLMAAIAAVSCGLLAADGGRPQNLISNPSFEGEIRRPWSLVPGVVRKETAALSGKWMLSAIGRNYFIANYMDDPELKWNAGEEFTIAVDVRSAGSGAALMVIHRYATADGKVGEGWATRIQPTAEWHEYVIPFKATAGGRPLGFSFYKIDNGAHDTGIEIRSFRMYRGRISALDFIPIGRSARASVLEGSELPMKPSLFGCAARPMKALVAVRSLTSVREAKRVFAGTGAQAHVIVAEGKGASTFMTDDDPKMIRHLLKTGGYDLYAFGRRSAAAIGEELFAIIGTNVQNGASVYFAPEREGQCGLFNGIHAAAPLGRYGRGRVTAGRWRKDVEGAIGGSDLSFIDVTPLADEYAVAAFPYEEVELAKAADRMWRAAFGEPDLTKAKKVVDECVYRGRVHSVERHVDNAGLTLAFVYHDRPAPGATLGEMVDDGSEVTIPVSNATASAVVKWRFSDFSGRRFGEGHLRSPWKGIAVPRDRLYTGLGVLEAELIDRGRVTDRRNYMVIEPGNDRERMIGDYGVGFWSVSSAYTRMDRRDMVRALGDLGFRYAFCHGGWGDMYVSGMAATLSYVIGGEYFSGGPTSKGNVRSPVFNTPEARRRIRDMATRWAKDNRRWGGMYGSFSDEAQLGPNGEEVDAHPDNLKAYRKWMERKYGTIGEYNRRHLTSHRSFADLGQTLLKDARAAGNAAEFIEWRTFNVDRWVEVIREVGDAIREVDPDLLYSLDNCFGERALGGTDFWKLLTKTGLDYSKEYTATVSFGEDPFREFDFLYRSWRPDMRIWGWTGYGFTEERERALPWMTALHRQGGFHWFAATYYGINLLDLATGAPTLDARECGESLARSRMTEGLGKTLTDWNWAKGDVAIYYSHDSCILSFFLGTETLRDDCHSGTPYRNFQYSRSNANFMLAHLFYQPEWVSSEQVEGGFLDGGDWSVYRAGKVIAGQPPFKALIMPHILAMSDSEVAAVKAFIRRGGKVVCDVLPGEYDELGVRRSAPPFSADEVEAFATAFDSGDEGQRRRMLSLMKSANVTPAIESPTAMHNPYREAVHYCEGDVDLYGVIRKPLHSLVGKEHDTSADELVFARRGHVYDVRERRYLGVGDRVSANVPYAEACLYAVLKEKIDAIGIAGLPRLLSCARRGETLSLDFKVISRDVAPRYVLHVEFIPPSGKRPFHFRRNVATANGKASVRFPIALNDETGKWTLRVTEPLTGISSERNFTVK